MSYDVGEVVFLFSNKNQKIIPAMINAITTVKKLNGVETSHEIIVPGVDKKVIMEKLDVKIFKDIESLRRHGYDLVKKQVDSEINHAEKMAEEAWNVTPAVASSTTSVIQSQDLENNQPSPEDIVQVELEDGMKARLHLPKDLL